MNLNKALEKIYEENDFTNWEPGDEECFVFNDGVVIIGLSESRKCTIKVIVGEPTKYNMNLSM